jgi:hypothetical protein
MNMSDPLSYGDTSDAGIASDRIVKYVATRRWLRQWW